MEIELTISNYRCFTAENPARITLGEGFHAIVGVNNSGKSSLLKFFFEMRPLFRALSNSNTIYQALTENQAGFGSPQTPDVADLFHKGNGDDLVIEILAKDERSDHQIPKYDIRHVSIVIANGSTNYGVTFHDLPTNLGRGHMTVDGTKIKIDNSPFSDLSVILEAFQLLQDTAYIGAFRNAINVGGSQAYYDIRVGQEFINQWDGLKNGQHVHNRQAARAVEFSLKTIFGYSDLQINPSQMKDDLLIVLDYESFWLREMGSGLAQFIMVFANAAMRRPSYLLIDEPELNLHPSIQTEFLLKLASFSKTGVLFATHSVGLARAMTDQIYSITVDASVHNVQRYDDTPRLSEMLGELSYSSYRARGWDRLLLVEGVHDVTAVKELLGTLDKKHVLVMSAGGDQLMSGGKKDQLEELTNIVPEGSFFALADSERASKDNPPVKARVAFNNSCEELKIDCHLLERRAIENYFPDRAIKIVLSEAHSELEPYQKVEDGDPSWRKSSNWRIAREMTKDEILSTDLGEFLARI